MIPTTPITEEVRLPKFVQEEWSTILSKIIESVKGGWKGMLYTSYAMIDRGDAFGQLLTVPLDDGLSRTWALVNIHNHPCSTNLHILFLQYWTATRENTNNGSTLPPLTTVTSTTTTSDPPQPSGDECTMPVGAPCTTLISPGDKVGGLGAYYDRKCAQGGIGCDYVQTLCRLCAKKPELIGKPYLPCPACV